MKDKPAHLTPWVSPPRASASPGLATVRTGTPAVGEGEKEHVSPSPSVPVRAALGGVQPEHLQPPQVKPPGGRPGRMSGGSQAPRGEQTPAPHQGHSARPRRRRRRPRELDLLSPPLPAEASLPASSPAFTGSAGSTSSLPGQRLTGGFGLVGRGHVTGPRCKGGWETGLWFPPWEVRLVVRQVSPGKGGVTASPGLHDIHAGFSHSQTPAARLTGPSVHTSAGSTQTQGSPREDGCGDVTDPAC